MTDDPPHPDSAQKTVFAPTGPAAPQQSTPPAPPPPEADSAGWSSPDPEPAPEPDVAPATGWAPLPAAAQPAVEDEKPSDSVPVASTPSAAPGSSFTGFAPAPGSPGKVEVGAVLNHIYQVTRFIARGGMGEVYEGLNLAGDERVAIKVMLPSLAADENVRAMFRKEARTLTKLQHPALVQYRVLAQEPALGVLYIVTEFIDGPNLCDQLATLKPSPQQLRALTRRLAEGLRAAHELGAVHRDISPDNVLLADGRLDRAKIIDFGIAKDLDPSKQTIVGDGFAGKLGYVAPEQFGDFGREVGPWTDIYSLGLVILAVALGKNVDMGATLVDAVDKRRAGPDLSPIPPDLRPVLDRMLQADPAKRFRSMDEVIAALDAPAAQPAAAAAEARTVFQPATPRPPSSVAPALTAAAASGTTPIRKGPPLPALLGGGAVAALVIGGAVFLMLPKGGPKPASSDAATAGPTAAGSVAGGSETSGLPPSERARRGIESAFPKIGCTWLDLTDITAQGGAVSLKLAGVAGSPVMAQTAVTNAAAGAGTRVADVSLEEVAPVDPPVCTALDAFRGVRADTSQAGRRLSTPQRSFSITKQTNGKLAGRAVINMALRDPTLDFALFGLEPTGKIDAIIPSRAAFAGIPKDGQAIADMGGDTYRLQIDTDHQGWSGLLLLTGKGPFDPALVAAPATSRGPDWPSRFKAAASTGGWKAEMVWYKTVAG